MSTMYRNSEPEPFPVKVRTLHINRRAKEQTRAGDRQRLVNCQDRTLVEIKARTELRRLCLKTPSIENRIKKLEQIPYRKPLGKHCLQNATFRERCSGDLAVLGGAPSFSTQSGQNGPTTYTALSTRMAKSQPRDSCT